MGEEALYENTTGLSNVALGRSAYMKIRQEIIT